MAELCVYQQLSEAKGCRSIFFMCAQLSTSFYSLLYIWRVLGGLCGAVVGGLTDRQPLIGGIGVLFPNIQFSINQGKQLDSFIYILIYTSKHLWETTKWNIGVIKIKKKFKECYLPSSLGSLFKESKEPVLWFSFWNKIQFLFFKRTYKLDEDINVV